MKTFTQTIFLSCMMIMSISAMAAEPTLIDKGDTEASSGRCYKAIMYYQRVLLQNADDTNTRYKLAKCYVTRRLEDKAIDHLGQILSKEPNHIDALLMIADIYAGKEDWITARTYYEQVIRADANNALGHLGVGNAMKKSGDNEGAEVEYKKFEQLMNTN